MKKILTILLIFCVFVANAQNRTIDKALGYEDTYVFFTGSTTDALSTTDTTWTYTIWKKTDSNLNVYVDMLIDSVGGTANNVTIYLQNKRFTDQDWTTIDSTVWNGSGSKLISFAPSGQTISGTITMLGLTDTTGLSGYPADSIATTGTFTGTYTSATSLGMYTRIYVLGADNTLLADIKRLNFHFVKQ